MNKDMQRNSHRAITLMLLICLASAYDNESCTNIRTLGLQDFYSKDFYPYYYSWIDWYNTTFWGGYHIIAWQDQIPTHCWNRYTGDNILVLSEKHPAKLELTEAPQSLHGHLLSQTGVFEGNVTVHVRKCNDDVLYQMDVTILWNAYICFDRIYKDTCDSPSLPLPASKIGNSSSVIKLKWSEIKLGWYDTSFGDQNYTLPLIRDVYDVNSRCFATLTERGLYVQAVESIEFGELPTGLRVCFINEYEYESNYQNNDGGIYWYSCDYHVFVRSCNGKLIFDLALLAYLEVDICLIRTDNVKVVPEIHHSVQQISYNNKIYNQYNPSLQYRCSFQMKDSYTYEVTWYTDGEFLIKRGPTKDLDDLVLTQSDLNSRPLGYKVKCSVKTLQNDSDNGSLAIESENFFAGYEFSDKHITISTHGFTPLTVWKTVPTGCSYSDLSPGICEEPLTLIDTSARYHRSKRSVVTQQNNCPCGVNSLNADDHSTFQHMVKTLRAGETWTGPERYKFDLETIDDTYQDSNKLSARVNQNGIVSDNPSNEIQMSVLCTKIHVDKVCYSHGDPHMRTADGRWYIHHRVGEYLLYQQLRTEIQVQEKTKKCFEGSSRLDVCACAVNVRAGADLFTINRCEDAVKIQFEQCGDCGILDVVKKSDIVYEIFTPTSTRISVKLLENFGDGRNIDIDIYLGEKDENNTAGLCGYFDGNGSNDFRLRNGKDLNGNVDYKFSDDWRLSDSENLFKYPGTKLTKYRTNTRRCFRNNSITLAKCQEANPECSGNRQKRANDGKHLKMIHGNLESQKMFRLKRDTETKVTEREAQEICRHTVMSAPAVIEFPDKLANEDLGNVVDQCIFDVTQTNDVSWAKAHEQALNNLAINILNLNPVYKANNSGLVETFLKQTCVNNCSNNGVCSNEGICSCNGVYRGFDCGVDIRVPPLIVKVTDSGICDAADEIECRCFVIHTNHIFEGFRCEITTFKMSFNGSRYELGRSNNPGEYSDLYTGECCAQVERTKKNDVEEENFIHSYDIAISNDGEHFSDISSVYVYDAKCLLFLTKEEINTIELKSGYCFIDDVCVKQGSTHKNKEENKCCNPQTNMYSWTDGECAQENSGLEIATVIGIVTGILSVAAILTALFICMKCHKRSDSQRYVGEENETAHDRRLEQSKDVKASGETKDEVRSTSTENRVIVPNFGDLPLCSELCIESSTPAKPDDEQNTERCLSAVSLKIV